MSLPDVNTQNIISNKVLTEIKLFKPLAKEGR